MMPTTKKSERKTPSQLAAHTAKWAVIMAKVAIRQAIADNPWPHWHILSFTGPAGSESRGVVDLMAVRKDHGKPLPGTKLGNRSGERPDRGAHLQRLRRRHELQGDCQHVEPGRHPDFTEPA